MQKISKFENCFKTLYALPIKTPVPDPQNSKVFHKAIEYIAKHGEPKDAIELLMLIDLDTSKPSFTLHLKKAGEVIRSLMTKESVRREWSPLEDYFRSCLIKYRDRRVDDTIHYPEFNDCCELGCCEHDASYEQENFEKTRLLSMPIIPLLKDNFPPHIAAHLLGIASFDPDDSVRKKALEEMVQLNTGNMLPYLLLRLNDVNPEIQSLGQNILKTLLKNKKITLSQIVWCRPLIKKAAPETQKSFSKYSQSADFNDEITLLLQSNMDAEDKSFLIAMMEDSHAV